MTFEQEFRIIDAQHAMESRMRAEIEILRTRLRMARGEFVPLGDKWRLWNLVERYPEFREPGDRPRQVI